MLSRLTFTSALSHLRRVRNPLPADSKATRPRQLHNSQWGLICPAETPEGGPVGLVKNLALMAYISVQKDAERIHEILENQALRNFEEIHPRDISQEETTKVWIVEFVL